MLASTTANAPQLNLPISQGEQLLVHITFGGTRRGSFDLDLTNRDQYSEPALGVLQFPAGADPSQEAIADYNRDGKFDVAIADAGSNTVSILLGNGDGTFDAQQFSVGAFRLPNPVGTTFTLNTFRRDIISGDFNADGIADLAVTNYDSSDVSILLGRGDGTFLPQRRFDATVAPYAITVGDVNGDGHLDLLVADAVPGAFFSNVAVLLGRGDGSFQPERLQQMPRYLADPTLALADLNGDGRLDLISGGGSINGVDLFMGDGQGAFTYIGTVPGTRQATDLIVTDLNGDGNVDILATSLSVENSIYFLRGLGNGAFAPPVLFFAGQSPIAVKVVDWGSRIALPGGGFELGPPDGIPDLVVANSGAVTAVVHTPGPPGIVVLPGLGVDAQGDPQYGAPITIATAEQPLDLDVHDFNDDGRPDLGIVDHDKFFVIFGKPSRIPISDSKSSAHNLGTVVHLAQPTLTITPDHENAWVRLPVPTEIVSNRSEVLDISSGLADTDGPGIGMEVVDDTGRMLRAGDRFRIVVRQGEELFVHLFAKHSSTGVVGSGAYTLVIDTLPQVVAVKAQSLLPGFNHQPGGPTTSLVLVMQGDRLDTAAGGRSAELHRTLGRTRRNCGYARRSDNSCRKRVARGI